MTKSSSKWRQLCTVWLAYKQRLTNFFSRFLWQLKFVKMKRVLKVNKVSRFFFCWIFIRSGICLTWIIKSTDECRQYKNDQKTNKLTHCRTVWTLRKCSSRMRIKKRETDLGWVPGQLKPLPVILWTPQKPNSTWSIVYYSSFVWSGHLMAIGKALFFLPSRLHSFRTLWGDF